MKCAIGVVVLLLLCTALLAQQPPEVTPTVSTYKLVSSAELTPTQFSWTGDVFGPIVCDSSGNVYLHHDVQVVEPSFSGDRLMLTRIATTGETTDFDAAKALGIHSWGWTSRALAVDPNGRVAEAVTYTEAKHARHSVLLFFSDDGTSGTTIDLNPRWSVINLLTWSNGNSYLSGLLSDDGGKDTKQSFSVILDRTGRIVRDLKRASDDRFSPQPDSLVPEANPNVQWARAVIGPDELAYVVKPGGEHPSVEVINSSGEVQRRIRLWVPFQPAIAMQVFAGQGRMLIGFQSSGGPKRGEAKEWTKNLKTATVEYDIFSGAPLALFDPSELKGSFVACYANNEITFIRMGPDRRVMLGVANVIRP